MPRLRLVNGSFERGILRPWRGADVQVTSVQTCQGRFSARFDGDDAGMMDQTTRTRPFRNNVLVFQAGATGPVHSPLRAQIEFLNRQRTVIGAVSLTIPADSLPNVSAATPLPCRFFCLFAGMAPPETRFARVSFQKLQPGGADILVDSVALLEF